MVQLLSYINPLSQNFILNGVLTSLSNALNYINPLSDNFFGLKILDLLGTLLTNLFIPEEGSLTNIANTVKSKFSFVDTISNYANRLKDMANGLVVAPVLDINLGESRYFNGGEVRILDLSWYAPYKPYGDTILTAFIYGCFIWRLFIKIPSIISGAGGVVDKFVDIGKKE